MAASFTVDIAGAEGMRSGDWADGEEFWIRCGQDQKPVTRVRLRAQPGFETAGDPGPVTVAEVEARSRAGGVAPHPVMELTDADGAPLATVHPRQPVPRPREFALADGEGRPLARLTHDRSRLGRGRWRIEFADGSEPLTGREGTAAGWLVYLLTLPLWLVLFLGSLLVALVTLGNVAELAVWSRPCSTVWRRGGAPPLTGRVLTFSHLRTVYGRPGRNPLDERVAHAQAALHYFERLHGG